MNNGTQRWTLFVCTLISLGIGNSTLNSADTSNKHNDLNDLKTKNEQVWDEVCKQRNQLEKDSQSKKTPLRETLNKLEFNKIYPLLPKNRQLESGPLPNNIEIRMATIPKNLKRSGNPYSMVAILYYNENNILVSKVLPDNIKTRRILSLTSNWENAESVQDPPIILIK